MPENDDAQENSQQPPAAAAASPGDLEDEEVPPEEQWEGAFPQAAQQETPDELENVIDDLEEEYGEEEVTESMIDAAYSESYAEFIEEAEDRMKAEMDRQNGKARFYVYRDVKGAENDFYLLKNLTPKEGKAEWLDLPRMDREQTQAAIEEILEAVLLYPAYTEVDWDYEGDGMYSPTPFTKREIVEVYWKHEAPSPQQPTDTAIGDVEKTAEVAREYEDKPSL